MSAASTGCSSCVGHAPSRLPKPLQPWSPSSLSAGEQTFPYRIGRGRQLSDEHDDFRYYDFPKHDPNTEGLLCIWRDRADAVLLGEMLLVLRSLAGSEGERVVLHFIQGNGKKLRHPHGSPLSGMAARSWQFQASLLKATLRIQIGVKALAASGKAPDFPALRVELPATHWGLRDFPTKADASESTALKAIVGGTQGEDLYATSLKHDPFGRTYELGLRWEIFDHFGVGNADLYAPGLLPFYVLQHERKGYRPFVNEIVIHATVRGMY